ncbi:hypothetical protein Tco_1121574 [Tanacetum coccineum]|uniref:Uncharacterized protein n=1 Tax=Tanacetum coccineum TaxID=301880 RepID=A0ABQ5J1S3_9ASTR
METKDTLSSCSYSDEQDMQQMLKQAKILKGAQDKFEKISAPANKAFKLDGMYEQKGSFHDIYSAWNFKLFKETILKNFDFIEDYMLKTIIHAQTIQKRLDDKKLQIQECTVQEVKALDAILEDKAPEHCMMFIKSRMYLDDEFVVMTRNYFLQYTQLAIPEFRDTLIQHMESVKKSIDERAQHNEVCSWVKKTIQTTVGKVVTGKSMWMLSLVNTRKALGTGIQKSRYTSSRSGMIVCTCDDADIRHIYDEEPMVDGTNNC